MKGIGDWNFFQLENLLTWEDFTKMIPQDPVVWVKWVIVFAVIVFMYIVVYRIEKYVNPTNKLNKRIERAIENGHVCQGSLVDGRKAIGTRERAFGIYKYSHEGKEYKYTAHFEMHSPPHLLNLYYDENPKKVYSKEENRANPISGPFMVMLYLSPFLVGAFAAWLLGVVKI